MVRCFICVEVEKEENIQSINQILEKIRVIEGIRPVKPNQLHITLKFLGEITNQQVTKMIPYLEEISYKKFPLKFEQLGCFPHNKRPRVIWLGVAEGRTELVDLAKIIEKDLVSIDFPRERRKFSPHLTLGRVKRLTSYGIKQIEDFLLQEEDIPEMVEETSRFFLKKSTLTPKGAIYENLAEFTLQ